MLGFMYLTFYKNKQLQMEFFSHNVIFKVSVYIFLKFEIDLMNEKYIKTF
jgi:hypothetical protein